MPTLGRHSLWLQINPVIRRYCVNGQGFGDEERRSSYGDERT